MKQRHLVGFHRSVLLKDFKGKGRVGACAPERALSGSGVR